MRGKEFKELKGEKNKMDLNKVISNIDGFALGVIVVVVFVVYKLWKVSKSQEEGH